MMVQGNGLGKMLLKKLNVSSHSLWNVHPWRS